MTFVNKQVFTKLYLCCLYTSISHLLKMALIKCPGCDKEYENGSSLSAHQRRCSGYTLKANARLKKRQKILVQKKASKIARHVYSADDIPFERAELRKEVNLFDVDEPQGGKRKLRAPKVVYMVSCYSILTCTILEAC